MTPWVGALFTGMRERFIQCSVTEQSSSWAAYLIKSQELCPENNEENYDRRNWQEQCNIIRRQEILWTTWVKNCTRIVHTVVPPVNDYSKSANLAVAYGKRTPSGGGRLQQLNHKVSCGNRSGTSTYLRAIYCGKFLRLNFRRYPGPPGKERGLNSRTAAA